jgi:hypothetical protein
MDKTERQIARERAYFELCVRHGVLGPDDRGRLSEVPTTYSGTEDAVDQLLGEDPICRYAIVTEHGEHVYVTARNDYLADAKRSAAENLGDHIYAETPMEIVNLDNGKVYEPDWGKVAWSRTKP